MHHSHRSERRYWKAGCHESGTSGLEGGGRKSTTDGNSSAPYPTSPTYACGTIGCTWWPFSIGIRAMCWPWELDQTMQVGFVLEAMQRALTHTRPVICNSDQGSQFTSAPYLNLLKAHEV